MLGFTSESESNSGVSSQPDPSFLTPAHILPLGTSMMPGCKHTVDGKNLAPLRMPQMLVLYQYQDLLVHPKGCRIFSINRMCEMFVVSIK